MRAAFRWGGGLFYAIISIIIVVGALSLALTESYTTPHPTASPVATLDAPHILQTLVSTQMAVPSATTAPPLPSSSTPQPPANCPPPSGWYLISIQPGDTLAGLATRFNTTSDLIRQANCLLSDSLVPGYGIYVPASAVRSPVPCGPPYGWQQSYLVQPGDTLFHIALLYGTSVTQLQRANCRSTTGINTGERLWVPNSPTITPGVTVVPDFGTPTEVPTLPFTTTPLPYTATVTVTDTPSPTLTFTPIPATATITAFPTATP